MKATPSIFLIFALLTVGNAFAQGDLAPPGPPEPTMKTLDQIEPRVPISAPADITQPGSYYLTQGLLGGGGPTIRIKSSDVTLDLRGFTVASSNALTPAILVDGVSVAGPLVNVRIHNGSIKGPGSGLSFGFTRNLVIEHIGVSGTSDYGIGDIFDEFDNSGVTIRNCQVGDGGTVAGIALTHTSSATVENCTVSGSAGDGIKLSVSQSSVPCHFRIAACSVTDNGGRGLLQEGPGTVTASDANFARNLRDGIQVATGQLTRCKVSNSVISGQPSSGNYACGIRVGDNSVLTDCIVSDNTLLQTGIVNGESGIRAGSGSTLTRCVVSRNQFLSDTATAIVAEAGSILTQCVAESNVFAGQVIFAFPAAIYLGAGGQLTNCTSRSNRCEGGAVFGILLGEDSKATGCVSSDNSGTGIIGWERASISSCSVSSNKLHGIYVSLNSQVTGNTCVANGADGDGAGIYSPSSGSGAGFGNRIEGNMVKGNDRGIEVNGPGNTIIRNFAKTNTSNYEIAAGNTFGPITLKGPSPAFSGNGASGGTMTSDHPWANFTEN